MIASTKYFSDLDGETFELVGTVCGMPEDKFRAKFPGVKGLRWCGAFAIMCKPGGGIGMADMVPVTRRINYKSHPSLHECNARCMGGKCGGTCECKCGGKNHGINS